MDKADLIARFRALLAERLALLEDGQLAARDGTRVDGTHRPTNRGERAAVTSQSYLALGLGQRAAELRDSLQTIDRIPVEPRDAVGNGALLDLEDEDGERLHVLLLPGGDGTTLDTPAGPVLVLSTRAPLVRDLIGEEAGATATVQRSGRPMVVEILQIA